MRDNLLKIKGRVVEFTDTQMEMFMREDGERTLEREQEVIYIKQGNKSRELGGPISSMEQVRSSSRTESPTKASLKRVSCMERENTAFPRKSSTRETGATASARAKE